MPEGKKKEERLGPSEPFFFIGTSEHFGTSEHSGERAFQPALVLPEAGMNRTVRLCSEVSVFAFRSLFFAHLRRESKLGVAGIVVLFEGDTHADGDGFGVVADEIVADGL